jgi:hypothetical protein
VGKDPRSRARLRAGNRVTAQNKVFTWALSAWQHGRRQFRAGFAYLALAAGQASSRTGEGTAYLKALPKRVPIWPNLAMLAGQAERPSRRWIVSLLRMQPSRQRCSCVWHLERSWVDL